MNPRSVLSKFYRLCTNIRRKPEGINFSGLQFTDKPPHYLKCYSSWSSNHKYKNYISYGYLSIGALGLTSLIFINTKHNLVCYAKELNSDDDKEEITKKVGKFIEGLPVYRMEEIEKHKQVEDRLWVIYKDGVYDVTDFVEDHPGGKKILLAGGGSIEPFWLLYGVHNSPEVYELLETFRIGNLCPDDKVKAAVAAPDDPYRNDPQRNPVLLPASVKPFNAEPPPSLLTDEFLTPNELFYVRNHLPVPDLNENDYRLEISGLGVKKTTFTLADLKKFPKHTVTSVIQCAGNRRSEMNSAKPVMGLTWNHAAIGNAEWSGARLKDVLDACGYTYDPKVKHVQFEGYDRGPENQAYGSSVPASKVFDPMRDVLIAYEMNGKELPRDHGYPVRIIVPGIVGARNVKWLSKIILSEDESESFWQKNDYKVFSPSTTWNTADFSRVPAIQDLPINSAICMPMNGESVQVFEGCILVRGYAWSGGGHDIIRVDVSTDQGENWHDAELEHCPNEKDSRWAWTLWSILVPVNDNNKEAEIWVRAVDDSYNTQPESMKNIWNLRGLLANAYHKVNVKLEKD